MGSFNDQYVLITGSTRGIGKVAAKLFIENGAKVIITGTASVCPDSLTKELEGNFHYLQANFASNTGIESFLLELEQFPRIDVCINNAGINRIFQLEDIADKDYEEILSVNLHAPFRICKYLAVRMKKQKFGRVVNVASIWSKITKPGRTAYTISKNAIVGLTQTMAVELASHGVIVNAISPGFTSTELTESTLSAAEMDQLSGQLPIRRFAEPIEIARVILFLASTENSYMTGQNIVVDGGFTHV